MHSLRKKETEERYAAVKKLREPAECGICNDQVIRDFAHWSVIANRFPYDTIASVHHMLVPKRHAREEELTKEEWEEFGAIKRDYVASNYEIVMESMPRLKSIPEHFHLHLVVLTPG